MNQTDVPIWEKYTLTIEEAAKYFRIGENKLRKLAEENPNANWVIFLLFGIVHMTQEAIEQDFTKPITAWKNKWCEKNINGEFVLKDTAMDKLPH